MFSPTGFLLGAVLGALGLLFLIDTPQAERITAAVTELTDQAIDSSADAAAQSAPIPRPAPEVTPEKDEKAMVADEADPFPQKETRLAEQPALAPTEQLPLAESRQAMEEAVPVEGDELVSPQRWHAFWRPFHSRLSAEGFARRIAMMTGLEVDVTEQTPGEFSVVFPYSDDHQKWMSIGTIELATGLKLSKEAQ